MTARRFARLGEDGRVHLDVPPEQIAAVALGLDRLISDGAIRGREVAPELVALLRTAVTAEATNRRGGLRPRKPRHTQAAQWLTSTEVAGLLGVSSARVRQLRIEGRFPGARRTSAGWTFPADDVTAYREARRWPQPPPPPRTP